MPKGKRLHAKDEKDQCEAVTFETHWKRARKVDLRCPFIAKLTIGKKRLCNRHAMVEALAMLVSDGTAEVIVRPPARTPYQPVSTRPG